MARILLGLLILKIISLVASYNEDIIGDLRFLCLSDWEPRFGNCYRFVNVPENHKIATDVCKSYGSKLANPKDENEYHYLKEKAVSTFMSGTKFWIGYSKGEDNDCHGYWDNFQPDWSEGNCVVMKKDDGLYAVNNCDRPYSFVCQKKACINSSPCTNDKCVPSNFLNDGRNDCGDNSDEKSYTKFCNFFYKDPFGDFTANPSSVQNNSNCIITIEASIGSRIIMEVKLNKPKIDDDYLEIWSGGSDASERSLIGRPIYSKTTKFYSKNNFVFVKYYTTRNVAEWMFEIKWNSFPIYSGTLQATDSAQELKSPGDSMLFSNLELSWKIEAPTGSIITLQLTELVLRNSKGNSLEIWYGDVMAHKLTGSTNNQVFISNTNEVYIYLNTENEACKGGFTLTYQEGCNINLGVAYGQISSPGFNTIDPSSSSYMTNTRCTWEIDTSDATRFFTLQFAWFNLTGTNDVLEVYNGNISLKNLTGDNAIDNIHTTTNVLRLQFTSSVIHEPSGFNATFYRSCPDIKDSVSKSTIVKSNDTAFLAKTEISCDPGHVFKQEEYTHTKTQFLICNAGGTWNKKPYPSCQLIACEILLDIENGLIFNTSGITYGSRAYYKCNEGHFMASSNSYAECNEFGKWTDLPICEAYNCSSVAAEPNSVLKQLEGTDVEVGAVKQAVCDPGYELVNSGLFRCLPTMTWLKFGYSCKVKSCELSIDPKSIVTTKKTLAHNGVFSYFCLRGCTIGGTVNNSLQLTCNKGNLTMPDGDIFTKQYQCEGTGCLEKVDSCNECDRPNIINCENVTMDKYVCNCKSDYYTKTCMQIINYCDPNPCQNTGTCFIEAGTFRCECAPGWFGTTCEERENRCLQEPCKNGGQCYNYPDNYFCRCPKGFNDSDCTNKQNKCDLQNICTNGGTCAYDNGSCNCPENFKGLYCEIQKDVCKTKTCQDHEECVTDGVEYRCKPKTDYFPCTDKSEICKTVPCYGMESISECQSCKNSSEDFDIFFDSNNPGGATLSHYAKFKANDFSVCMELLFSDQNNSKGTFITLLKENGANISEEYLSIGSKGITLNSQNYDYTVDLNTKTWSSLCVAISENGDTVILVRKFKKISMQISPLQLINETFTVVIGQNFYGYITKVNIFNQLLTYNLFLNLPEPPYIKWANYVPGWGAKFQVPSRNPLTDICDFDVDSSKCASVPNKTVPEFTNCNTADRNVVCPRLNCSLNITPPEATQSSIASTINPKGSVYNWGAKNVIFEARSVYDIYATCQFKLFVKYKTCENPARFNPTSCSIDCPTGEALCMPFPFKLSCSKLGVFNRTHPFNDMLIPPCGNEEPFSIGLNISFKYIMVGVICSKTNVLADITKKAEEITKKFIGDYTGFCHNNCSTIQYITDCNDTSDINMTIVIPYTATTIKRNSDGVNVPTFVEVEKLVFLQNVYKQMEVNTLGTLVPDSMNVTSFPECQFGYGLVNNKCVQCGLGTYYDDPTHSCYYCPLGHYQSKRRQSSCEQCPNNKTTKAVGAQKLDDCYENCPPGFYFDKKNCTSCDIGFYQNNSGQMFCEPCPLGKTTYANESTSESFCFNICQPGYQLIENGTCEKCPRGYYRQFDYQHSCISCGINTTTTAAGSISPENCSIPACKQGEFLNDTICRDCPVGTYQDEIWQESCISCPDGTWTRGNRKKQNSSCEVYCSSGFDKKNATDSCSKCPVGFYRELDKLDPFALCTKCPDNFTTDGDGARNCSLRICPAGKFRNSATNACQDCPQGYYQPTVTTGNCLECPENYTTLLVQSKTDADCTFYCKFAGYEIGPSGKECIPCAKGFYKNASAGVKEKCSQCPQNFTTSLNEGATNLVDCDLRICPEGTFIKNDMCTPCPNATYQPAKSKYSCEKCPNNTYTFSEGTIKESDCQVMCGAGYEGQENCTLCKVNFFKKIDGAKVCSECPTHFLANTERTDCNVLNCLAGYYNATSTSCLPCVKGKYKDSVGNSECTSCPNSAYTTPATGSTSANNCTEVDCPPGYKFNSSSETCIVCPKGTYQTKRGNYPCVSCPGIFTTFGNASASENDCLIPNCPIGQQPAEDFLSCRNCSLGYYKSEVSSILCIKCPANTTTLKKGATDVSQCSKKTEPDPIVLSTVDIVIALQYSFPDCESKKAFYEEQMNKLIKERMKEISQNWNLCTGNCSVTVSINCSSPTSKRKKRATTNGEAEIRIGNVKTDTDSKITNEITKTENVFIQDCKVNSDQYKVDSIQLIGCVVDTSCTYSKLVSKICVKCPAGTKAVVTGCADCPGGTYSAIDQRDCTNCKSPLTSKPRSNSSQCLAKCLVDPAYCQNAGICSKGLNDLYHICICKNKFSGDQCEIYNGPYDPKQKWIFVGIGCIAGILVLILIVTVIIIHLNKKRKEKTKHDSTFDEEPTPNLYYGFPVQGYKENKPFATEWKDFKKF